jgi:MFS family permease
MTPAAADRNFAAVLPRNCNGSDADAPAAEPRSGYNFTVQETSDGWWSWFRRVGGLYVGAFTLSVSNGIFGVALPFRVLDLGGGPDRVGLIGGINQATYLAGLVGVLCLAGRLGLKARALTSLVGLTATSTLLGTVDDVDVLTLLAGMHGMLFCLFWPTAMAWVSTGVEGATLSRRLGVYNVSWSGGLVAGPLVGAALFRFVSDDVAFPSITACIVATLAAFALMTAPVSGPVAAATAPPQSGTSARLTPAQVSAAARASWLANAGGYLVYGMSRWQFPAMAVFLGEKEEGFALVLTVFSAATAVGFALLGRARFWHFNPAWNLGVQAAMITGLAAMWWVDSLAAMVVLAAPMGLCVAGTYYSSVYHGAAAVDRRDRAMTIHEIVLSVGFIAGAIGGGWLSAHAAEVVPGADVRIAYPAAGAVLAVLAIGSGMCWSAFAAAAAPAPAAGIKPDARPAD